MKPRTQSWDPRGYAENARFVSDLGVELIELLNPRPGERIMDLGCGDGALTAKLLDRGCAVVGVDASPRMVAAAQARGLDARVCDGHEMSFDREFDGVLSNASLHWMTRQVRRLPGIRARRAGLLDPR